MPLLMLNLKKLIDFVMYSSHSKLEWSLLQNHEPHPIIDWYHFEGYIWIGKLKL